MHIHMHMLMHMHMPVHMHMHMHMHMRMHMPMHMQHAHDMHMHMPRTHCTHCLRDVTVDDGALLPQRTVEVRLLLHVPAHRVPRSARTHAVEVGDECGEEGVKLARVRDGVRIRVRVRAGVRIRVRVRVGVRVGVGIGAGGLSPSMRTRCCSSRSCARSNVSIARTHSPASFFIRQVCTVSHTERVQPST